MLQILLSEMPCPALGSGLIETHVKGIQHIYCFKDLLLIYGNLDTEQRHSKLENKTINNNDNKIVPTNRENHHAKSRAMFRL